MTCICSWLEEEEEEEEEAEVEVEIEQRRKDRSAGRRAEVRQPSETLSLEKIFRPMISVIGQLLR